MQRISLNLEDSIIDYYENGLSLRETAKKLNVGHNTVRRVLLRNDIKVRCMKRLKKSQKHRKKLSESKKGKYKGKKNPFYGKKHKKETIEINREQHLGKEPWNKNKKGLQIAWNKNLTKETDAKVKKYSKTLSQKWKGISWKERWGNEKAELILQRRSGKNAFQWKGGVSFFPYDSGFNNRIKKMLKEEYKNRCGLCQENKSELVIHHINHNKQNSSKNNLIPLCRPCHTKVHHTKGNDDYWFSYFCYIKSRNPEDLL